jgi:hypothetical protein
VFGREVSEKGPRGLGLGIQEMRDNRGWHSYWKEGAYCPERGCADVGVS